MAEPVLVYKPNTVNSSVNRSNSEEESTIEIHSVENEDKLNLYQKPQRINSEHNRGVDGDLTDTPWPVIREPDKWNSGIDIISVNGSSSPVSVSQTRIENTVRDMWNL